MENTTETTEVEVAAKPVGHPLSVITETQIDQAAKLYMEKGLSAKQILVRKQNAKKTAAAWEGIQEATLYHHLRQHPEVTMRGKGRPGLTDEQKAFVVKQYSEEGLTLKAIQALPELRRRQGNKVTRWSLPTLSKAVKEAGVEVRRGRPASEAAAEEEAAE